LNANSETFGQPPQQNSGLERFNHPPLTPTLILIMSDM